MKTKSTVRAGSVPHEPQLSLDGSKDVESSSSGRYTAGKSKQSVCEIACLFPDRSCRIADVFENGKVRLYAFSALLRSS